MRVIERIDSRDIGPIAEHAVHCLDDIGVGVHREQDRHVIARGDAGEGVRDIVHAAAEIFAAVRGHQDDALARETLRDTVEPAGERRVCRELGARRVQRVDDGVAGDVDRRGRDILAAQRLGGGFGRREMLVGDRRDDAAVHFLGPGLVDVARAQARLDMADRHLAVICRERADHRCGGVALHDHPVGLFGIHHIAKPGQQPRGQAVERLARLHQIEVDVWAQIGDTEHLVEQPAMLRGDAGAHVEPALRLERRNDGKEFDRFGPGAEDDEDAPVIAPSTPCSAQLSPA